MNEKGFKNQFYRDKGYLAFRDVMPERKKEWDGLVIPHLEMKRPQDYKNYHDMIYTYDFDNGRRFDGGDRGMVFMPTPTPTPTPTPATPPGAYATWNPDDKSANCKLAGGNLNASANISDSGTVSVRSTVGVSSGKWYWELSFQGTYGGLALHGVVGGGYNINMYMAEGTLGWAWNGYQWKMCDGDGGTSYWGNTFGIGDIVGIALNMDSGKIWFAKNGAWQVSGDPEADSNPACSGLTGTVYAVTSTWGDFYPTDEMVIANFGSTAFVYPVPAGFNAGLLG
jgi:hypothetical protein